MNDKGHVAMPPVGGNDEERRLVRFFRRLSRADRQSVLSFAAFLAAGGDPPVRDSGPKAPRAVSRPAEETVIAAIKRLSHSYYMLERRALLSETSALMSAHLLQGRPAQEVIDELESVFARHYATYCGGAGDA